MNQFTIYKNYYYLIKTLKREEQETLSLAIFEYMFEDKEPYFEEDTNLFYVWENIKMPLNTSKNNSIRSIGKGAPIGNQNASKNKPKTNQKQTKNKPKTIQKTNQKQTNNIFLFLISNISYFKDRGLLRGKIKDWIDYKEQRNESYKERGLKSLLTQIQNNCEKYGDEIVMQLIDECMASNYKGIIFERLENRKIKESKTPGWFDKNIEVEAMTREEEQEIKDILEDL